MTSRERVLAAIAHREPDRVPVDLGATLYTKVTGLNEQYVIPAGGALYAYLVTVGAYTPTAQAVYTVKLKSIGV